jgi:AraC-like DNA-binding protein
VHLNRIARGTADSAALDEIHVSPLVQQVSSYLDAHIDEAISLDAVAQAAFLSKYYLERKFKEETGASIYQMLLQKRMIRARNLMREGFPLMQVAMRCGFADYSGFYKAFRSAYGVSPREYLAQM